MSSATIKKETKFPISVTVRVSEGVLPVTAGEVSLWYHQIYLPSLPKHKR